MPTKIMSLVFTMVPTALTGRPRTGKGTAARTNRAKLLGFAALLLVAGCTTTTITPELVTKPSQTYATVAVGEISMQGDLWKNLIPHFEAGLVKGLRESKVFAKTVAPGESTLPPEALIVSGKIINVDEGSAAARFIIGFGAGRAKARGIFEIHDSNGVALARFEAREAYSGGAGIGGASFVSMEQLLSKLGESTAKSVVRWSQGKPLQPPREE